MIIPEDIIDCQLDTDDGCRLVILDYKKLNDQTYGPISKNLFKVNASNEVVWQISEYPSEQEAPFLNIYKEDGEIYAYNGNSEEYKIDHSKATATPHSLMR